MLPGQKETTSRSFYFLNRWLFEWIEAGITGAEAGVATMSQTAQKQTKAGENNWEKLYKGLLRTENAGIYRSERIPTFFFTAF